jgi:hypothetical protein
MTTFDTILDEATGELVALIDGATCADIRQAVAEFKRQIEEARRTEPAVRAPLRDRGDSGNRPRLRTVRAAGELPWL